MQTVRGPKLRKKREAKSSSQKNTVERIDFYINTLSHRQYPDVIASKRNSTRKLGGFQFVLEVLDNCRRKNGELSAFQSRGAALN